MFSVLLSLNITLTHSDDLPFTTLLLYVYLPIEYYSLYTIPEIVVQCQLRNVLSVHNKTQRITKGNIEMPDPVNPEPVTQPAVNNPGGQPATDWEARFKGLQKSFDDQQKSWKTKEQSLESTVAQLTTEHRTVLDEFGKAQGTLKSTQEQIQVANKAAEDKAAETAIQKAENERLRLIMKYPALMPFEEKGALRTDLKGEALEAHLKTMLELNGLAGNKLITGAIPPGSGNARPGAPTKESLIAEMRKIAADPSKAREYAELNKQFGQLFSQ